MTAPPSHGRVAVAFLTLLSLAILAGCGGAGGSEQGASDTASQQAEEMPAEQGGGRGPQAGDAWEKEVRGDAPEWVDNVFPPPGSEAASVNEVQISHTAVGEQEGVRLVIDGVDVTAFSEPGRGVLTYDPNAGRAPVELESGTHRVTAVRVKLDEFGEPLEVVDRFGWTFTVL